MPKSFEKTRKHIAKKKNNVTALHENSRDTQRLRAAKMRDDKLTRVASARRKHDQPLRMARLHLINTHLLIFIVGRVNYFQDAVRKHGSKPLEMKAIQKLIEEYVIGSEDDRFSALIVKSLVHQNDKELSELKEQRRPGRPASTREDLLRMKIATDEKEFTNGFCAYLLLTRDYANAKTDLPDLTDADNVTFLDRWEGSWSYLSTLKWVRINSSGETQDTSFPPKGHA